MKTKESFLNAFNYCKENQLYIGTGNPNAPILIIGKECAKQSDEPMITPDILKMWESELVKENLTGWETFLYPERFTEQERMQAFQVCYPYKGQKNIKDRITGYNPDTHDPIYLGGTSDTWLKYQKLYDFVFHGGVKSDFINFHENVFITELNQIPSALSTNQDKTLRLESVRKREKMFRECTFFLQFPVIILACGAYPFMTGFNFEEIFDVKFDGVKRGEKSQNYYLHYNQNEKHVVIHTRQLSMAVRDSLLSEMAQVVCKFI